MDTVSNADTANHQWRPNVEFLHVDDSTRLKKEPEIVKCGCRGLKLVTLLFFGNLILEVLTKKLEKNIDVVRRGLSILNAMLIRLVITILGQLMAMMVEYTIGCADLNRLSIKVDVRVVSDDSSKSIEEMIRIDDHERGLYLRSSRRVIILLFLGIVAIASIVDIVESRCDGSIQVRIYPTRMNYVSVVINAPPLNAHIGNNLEDGLFDQFATLIGFIILDFVASHVLKWFGASQAWQPKVSAMNYKDRGGFSTYAQGNVYSG